MSELEHVDRDEIWCQQDGVICLTANEKINLLQETSGEHRGHVAWPSRSCDLPPADSFFVGLYESTLMSALKSSKESLLPTVCTLH